MSTLVLATWLLLAQAPARDGAATHLSLGVGTDFPVAVGACVRSELGPRIQLGLSAGVMPGAYVDTINSVMTGLDVYGDKASQLISATLTDSLNARAQVGFRPIAGSGFYVAGGYSFLGLGGRLTGTELLASVTGRTLESPLLERVGVTSSARLHQALLELGFRFGIGRHLQVETALSGVYTFSADSSLGLRDRPDLASEFRPLRSAAESWLNDRLERWIHGGSLSLRVYFRAL